MKKSKQEQKQKDKPSWQDSNFYTTRVALRNDFTWIQVQFYHCIRLAEGIKTWIARPSPMHSESQRKKWKRSLTANGKFLSALFKE